MPRISRHCQSKGEDDLNLAESPWPYTSPRVQYGYRFLNQTNPGVEPCLDLCLGSVFSWRLRWSHHTCFLHPCFHRRLQYCGENYDQNYLQKKSQNDTAQVTMMTQITGDDPDGTKHHQVCDRVCPWHPSLLVCFIVWNSYHINIIVISSLSFHCHRNQNHIDLNQTFTQVEGLPFNIIVTILIDCSQHFHLRL